MVRNLIRHGLQCYIITAAPLCQHPSDVYAQVGPAWHNLRRSPHKIALRLHQLFQPVTHAYPSRRILPCASLFHPCCKPGACYSLLLSAYGARGRNTVIQALYSPVTTGQRLMPVTGARLSCRRIAGVCRQTASHPVAEPFHAYPIPHGSTFAATIAGIHEYEPRACHGGVMPGITKSQYPSLQYLSLSAACGPIQTPFTGVRRGRCKWCICTTGCACRSRRGHHPL